LPDASCASRLTRCAPRLSLTKALSKPVTLGPKDVLKLTFQVVESDGEKPVQPHQAFVRFYDETTGEEGIQPVKVNTNGKAKFELVRQPVPPHRV
jgi:oligosaccharyltransferase complex subunit delta (ribophorin II)